MPWFPIWDDIKTFDGTVWKGFIEICSGGFPCQDISSANVKAKKLGVRAGKHSGLWTEFARIVREIEPPFIFIENSPLLISRGLDIVFQDLAEMGYDARWGIMGARHIAGYHKRDRLWILAKNPIAYAKSGRWSGSSLSSSNSGQSERQGIRGHNVIKSDSMVEGTIRNSRDIRKSQKDVKSIGKLGKTKSGKKIDWWAIEPAVGRVADEVASRVDRLKAIGNGQVPEVAAFAFKLLSEGWL